MAFNTFRKATAARLLSIAAKMKRCAVGGKVARLSRIWGCKLAIDVISDTTVAAQTCETMRVCSTNEHGLVTRKLSTCIVAMLHSDVPDEAIHVLVTIMFSIELCRKSTPECPERRRSSYEKAP